MNPSMQTMTCAIFQPLNKQLDLSAEDIVNAESNFTDHLRRQSAAVFVVKNPQEIKTKCEDALIYYASNSD